MSADKKPWRFVHSSWEYSFIYDDKDELVARCNISPDVTEDTQAELEPIKDARAEFIVRAVNAHEALLAIAQEVAVLGPGKCTLGKQFVENAIAALALASAGL